MLWSPNESTQEREAIGRHRFPVEKGRSVPVPGNGNLVVVVSFYYSYNSHGDVANIATLSGKNEVIDENRQYSGIEESFERVP